MTKTIALRATHTLSRSLHLISASLGVKIRERQSNNQLVYRYVMGLGLIAIIEASVTVHTGFWKLLVVAWMS